MITKTPQYRFGKMISKVLVKASNAIGNTVTDLVEGAMRGAQDEIIKNKRKK